MKDDYTLSYILATRNKLPYLKHCLEVLLAHKKEDEEILVADGASTDGSKDYLEGLKAQGKIDYFVSERDAGVAHAVNKLALASRGTLIKYLTDDDVYYYPALAECRQFMLDHPDVDLINTNGGTKDQDPTHPVRAVSYEPQFRRWMATGEPFPFNDMGVMLRRSSLPLTGLWDPGFPSPDAEFSFRLSSGKANMAWYTARAYVNISNPQSLSRTYLKRIKEERDRLNKFYLNKNPEPYVLERLKVLRNKLHTGLSTKADRPKEDFLQDWPRLIESAQQWLMDMHREDTGEFLHT